MNIFYSSNASNDEFYLSPDESSHCIRVLRIKKGEYIHVVDGRGRFTTCELMEDNPKKCKLKVIERIVSDKRKETELTIAIAPTKSNERFEIFLEKSTEIGIDKIIPVLCEHSERKIINKERYLKVLISAMKQSKSSFLPNISELTKFTEVLNNDFQGEKFIAHCYPSENKKYIKEVYSKGKHALILIGPEGDFSEEEVKIAITSGFSEISISDSRLRTETAGIVACQIIDFINS